MSTEEGTPKPGPMTEEEIDAFLGGPFLARLACLRPDGRPYVVPIWYQWSDEKLWFIGREKSAWCTYLDQDPRVAVSIDAEGEHSAGGFNFVTPKVIMEGDAVIVGRPGDDVEWQPTALAMASRYRGQEGADYVKRTADQNRWVVALSPSTTVTWRGGGWAKRYRE